MKKIVLAFGMFLVCVLSFPLAATAAEKFPAQPVVVNVGQGPGGSTDIIARSVQPFLAKELKTSVIVQNQVGAGGDVVNNFIWKAKPDGYNLVMTALPSYTIRELIKKQTFKVLEMSFISGVAGGDCNSIAVPYNSPIKNFEELKKAAAEKSLSVAAVLRGSNSWYASILMREATGVKCKFVPYDSGTEAITAAGGGHVDLAITSIISATQAVENKLVRLIAIFGEQRDPNYPNVPTMIDLGYKEVYFSTRQGLLGPPGMSKDIINIIAKAAAKAVKEPKFKEIADRQGFTIDPLPGPEFHKWAVAINEQAKKYLTKAGEIK
jgi:tripartite-type tricarboxylate transporter receptor subunit TctC